MRKWFMNLGLSIVLIALWTMALPPTAEAITAWHVETAATGKQYPMELGYDGNGNPGFVQMEERGSSTYLVYRYKSPGGWVKELEEKSIFSKPGLAFDKSGQPGILYVDYDNSQKQMYLIYAKRNAAGEWTKTTIKTASYIDYEVSLKFNSAGYPCAAYVISNTLYYATFNGTAWKEQMVCYDQELSYANLAFNGTTPAIAFTTRAGVKYAYLNGSKWVVQTVDDNPAAQGYRNRHWYINLCFGSSTPLISYFDQITSDTKFAYFMDGRWETAILEKSAPYANPVMGVHNRASGYEIYMAYTNYVRFSNTNIKLKKLVVNNSNDLKALNFTTQTILSKNIDMPPRLAIGLGQGRPGVAVSDYWGNKTFYISMQPKIQTVSSVAYSPVKSGVTESKNVIIANDGSLDLSIDEISASGSGFSVTGNDFSSIGPGQSGTVTVQFAPAEAGKSYSGTLTIKSNDPDKPVFNIALSGRSIGESADMNELIFDNGANLSIGPDETTYGLEVAHATEKIRIKPISAHAHAAIEITGSAVEHNTFSNTIPLDIGLNSITLTVVSEDVNETKTYTVNVMRRDSPDASLSGLMVSDGDAPLSFSPDFSPEIREYTVTLPDGEDDFTITPTASQGGSTIQINEGPHSNDTPYPASPDTGSNAYNLRVTAPDGETFKAYELTVLKRPVLTGLSLDTGVLEPGFHRYTQDYAAVVPRSTYTITVIPEAPAGCSAKINGENVPLPDGLEVGLEVGENLITAEVFSPDGATSRTYSLTVKRLEGLYGLSVGDRQVIISGDDFTYDLEVEITEEAAPIICGIPEGMRVKINGEHVTGAAISKNFDFSEGENEPITIELISPDCEETTAYTLTVIRRPLLNSLIIAGEEMLLWDDITFYAKTFSYNTTEATIVTSAKAGTDIRLEGNISYSGDKGNWTVANLHVGGNHIYLILTAGDGKGETRYQIDLQRQAVLSGLSVSEGNLSPEFVPDIYRYTVHVDEEVETISVSAIASPGVMVSVNNVPGNSDIAEEVIELSKGRNPIPVTMSLGIYTNVIHNSIYYVDVIRAGVAVPEEPDDSGSNNGSGSNSSGSSSSTPTYNAEVSGGGTLPISADMGTGRASIDLSHITGNLGAGGNTIIHVPPIQGISSYTANLPSSALSGNGKGMLTLNTGFSSITLPENMLSGTGLVGNVGITMGRADTASLPEDIQEAIGDRPVIRLTLSIDGKQADWNNPAAAVSVRIPYNPTAEELENPESIVVWYIDGAGNIIHVPNGRYDANTDTVTFQTTHFSMYSVAYNAVNFSDVTRDKWYYKAITHMAARGITSGTGNGQFNPHGELSRGQFLVLLMNAFGLAPDKNATENFADAGNTYYTCYLAAAKQQGLSEGIGNNLFAPNKKITRQEMFALLYNTLKVMGEMPEGNGKGGALTDFTDVGQIKSWAYEATVKLVESGVVSGSGGKLSPAATMTRAEMAQVLYNLM